MVLGVPIFKHLLYQTGAEVERFATESLRKVMGSSPSDD